MKTFFLKLKHWQLFMIIYGVPFIFQLIFAGFIIILAVNDVEPDFQNLFLWFVLLPIFSLIPLLGSLGWYWSVGTGLQDKIPEKEQMNTGFFKVSVIFPLIYFTIVLIGISVLASLNFLSGMEPGPEILFFIIPIHLFMAFCLFYNIYFVAKTYKSIELQRRATASEYLGEFFLIWFFFLGVWFIQPKINDLEKGENPFMPLARIYRDYSQ
ncbi:hypothetical protein OO013_05440 [Mangrovivirga sp. M17]|uniref:Uncharacterized protein n=1 Tax=Mangrovivirga halotolerans TaxID=2993936 RepID=A0ABT3RNB6_9BACT|nr:hypothetical protein [Mangrovivirga halotolerans]MCX2743297.1 hypothetical protein [Mangrovivirga halotolerans]